MGRYLSVISDCARPCATHPKFHPKPGAHRAAAASAGPSRKREGRVTTPTPTMDLAGRPPARNGTLPTDLVSKKIL